MNKQLSKKIPKLIRTALLSASTLILAATANASPSMAPNLSTQNQIQTVALDTPPGISGNSTPDSSTTSSSTNRPQTDGWVSREPTYTNTVPGTGFNQPMTTNRGSDSSSSNVARDFFNSGNEPAGLPGYGNNESSATDSTGNNYSTGKTVDPGSATERNQNIFNDLNDSDKPANQNPILMIILGLFALFLVGVIMITLKQRRNAGFG